MAIKTRLLGRDVQIRIAHNGVPFGTITAIKNFTFEVRQRILTEQYQGETSSRQDSIFDEVGGSFTIHPEGPEAFLFQKLLADKAIRRTRNEEQITIVFRTTFPDGTFARVTIPEAEFDPVPMNSSNRDAYVEMAFTYKAEKYSLET